MIYNQILPYQNSVTKIKLNNILKRCSYFWTAIYSYFLFQNFNIVASLTDLKVSVFIV